MLFAGSDLPGGWGRVQPSQWFFWPRVSVDLSSCGLILTPVLVLHVSACGASTLSPVGDPPMFFFTNRTLAVWNSRGHLLTIRHKSFNEGKKVAHWWVLCLQYKLYSFCFGLDLGLDAIALALVLMVLALLTSLSLNNACLAYFVTLKYCLCT